MKFLLKLFLFFIIAMVLVLGYFGFMPGVSKIFGSDKPRDLGVRFIEADFQSGRQKTGKEHIILPATNNPAESLKFSGSRPVKASFSSEETTALLSNRPWKYNPIKDGQFKINQDGTMEISGILLVGRIPAYIEAFGGSSVEAKALMARLKLPRINVPFYIKGGGAVINDELALNVEKMEIGRLSLPVSKFDENKDKISDFIEKRMAEVAGLSIKSLTIENGKLNFDGTLPAVEAYAVE